MSTPVNQPGEPPEFDVAVVGAGPTGLTTANFLGLLGVRTLLVERNATTVQEPRAVSIDDESLRTMQNCGLIDAVLRDVALDYGSVYLGPDGREFARVMPTLRDYGYPRRSAFRQPLFEATLLHGLQRFAHVETRFEHTLEGFEQVQDHVVLHLRDRAGKQTTASAKLLAGADGGRSAIRKAIGASLCGSSFEERWLIVDLKQTQDPFRETRVFCDPRRPAISLPGPCGSRRYEIRLLTGETEDEVLKAERIRELLQERGIDEDSPIERTRVYTFHARRADKWRDGRVFLLGDAAHLTPPFAGQGMNTGIRDAMNFAWKAAAVTSGLFDGSLLDTYEEERKPHAWSMIELALRMGRVMAPHRASTALLTRTVFRLLSLCPPARDYVAQMRFKPKPRFASGFIVHLQGRSQVGAMFPQPVVERTRGERLLLDQILGQGFSLVCIAEEAAPFFQRLEAFPIWSRLGCSRINILPRSIAFASGGGALVVRDADDYFGKRMAAFANRCFLLRPDRHVAAEMTLDDIDTISAQFTALCARLGFNEERHASQAPSHRIAT